jgi:AhpD family alkylhydroperoxidase
MIKKAAKTIYCRWGELSNEILFLPRNRTSLAKIMLGGILLTISSLFNRRWDIFGHVVSLIKNTRMVIMLMMGRTVSHAFRERLMLAVTAVYGCRYCTWLHTGEALKSGIGQEEIATLLNGSVDNCPEEEAVALLYAQHWADSGAKPDPQAARRLEQVYGTAKAQAINLILSMNLLGNLSGNTLDHFLYRVSLGKWGKLINTAE